MIEKAKRKKKIGKIGSLLITGILWLLTVLALLSYPLLAVPIGIGAILVSYIHLNFSKGEKGRKVRKND